MRTLDSSQLRKLRGLIARALDEASSDAEANSSARAACRLLAAEGLGVEGDPEAEISIGRCSRAARAAAVQYEPVPAYVVQAAQTAVGCAYCGSSSEPQFGRR